jgi:hypothetical protein
MYSLHSIFLFSILCISCNKNSTSKNFIQLHCEQVDKTQFNKTVYKHPILLYLTKDSLDYNIYQKQNRLQLYHHRVDFQGYLYAEVLPLIQKNNIEFNCIHNVNGLTFKVKDKVYKVSSLGDNIFERGLFLFNGKETPIYWQGDDYEGLELFIQKYYKGI